MERQTDEIGLVRGGDMEILVPLCPGVALVMDDVNGCDCGAGWPATGLEVPAYAVPSISLL